MSDQDDNEEEGFDEPRERRTEGVRIIGAQEAAAAAGRPDVVRRRRGGQKRYGDRPDAPSASEDLPRITISTTEHDDQPGSGTGGGEPAARPAGDHGAEPQWRTEDREAGGRDSYGHARVVSGDDAVQDPQVREPEPVDLPSPPAAPQPESYADVPDPEPGPPGAGSSEPGSSEPGSFERGTDLSEPSAPDPTPADAASPDATVPESFGSESFGPESFGSESFGSGSWSSEPLGPEPTAAVTRGSEDGPGDTTGGTDTAGWPDSEGWSDEPPAAAAADEPTGGWAEEQEGGASSIWDPEPLPWQSDAPGAAQVPSWSEAEPADLPASGGPAGFDDDEDSFILPHWTEPPTGQVPKVVIDEEPDPDAVASYGTQPRWRDEGERSAVTDFDDLVDQGPGLGALARHAIDDDLDEDDDFFSDGPSTEGGYAVAADDTGFLDEDDLYDDAYDDDLDAGLDDHDDEDGRRGRRGDRRAGRGGEPPSESGGGDRNLPVAVGVGLALVGVGLLCFWAGPLPTALLATVVVTLCGTEYFSAVRSAGHNPASLLGIVAVAGVMFATFAAGLAAYPVVLGLLVIGGLLWFLWVAPGEGAMANLGLTLLGVLWIGVLGSFSTLFLGLGRSVEAASAELTSNPGIGVLIAAVIASVTHDVGAYFTGKYLGRTPLSAASPSKTQEGLAGGVIVSIVATFVVVGLVGISPIGDDLARAFIFAVLCALVAPLGDLCESFIKRDLGIKDMGSVLPGHGGVLDRFDALLFVLPTAYFVTVLFEIWTVGAG